ncbi:hypothetical protein DRW42_00415 [Pedobacter miscanthi]|uniref:Uncharacterized protein n=1 Tax=Pedobacter miscanthi TaxID=2259170 RepID=A0A366LD09_9SPHI|nr:hypothetical protein DRW42_00415 [Pedobacter miscanthi]
MLEFRKAEKKIFTSTAVSSRIRLHMPGFLKWLFQSFWLLAFLFALIVLYSFGILQSSLKELWFQ